MFIEDKSLNPQELTVLQELLIVAEWVRDNNKILGMDTYGRQEKCGTVCCLAGWYALHPLGQARGFSLDFSDIGDGFGFLYKGGWYRSVDYLVELTGLPEETAWKLFCIGGDSERFYGVWDYAAITIEMVIEKLQTLIAQYEKASCA